MNKALLIPLVLLAGCAVQPDYKRPAVELPSAWKESAPLHDGNWWRVYADPVLEKLVEEALARNSDLARAAARVDEARALVRQNPQDAFAWASRLPAERGLSAGREAFTEWRHSQPESAMAWLNELPSSDPRRKVFLQ